MASLIGRRDILRGLLAVPAWLRVAGSTQVSAPPNVVARTNDLLKRIAELNPKLNALVTVTPDRARADARDVAAQIVAGTAGPLAGMPIAHKDLFETAGIRTTAGSRLFENYIPNRSATIVTRLEAAGAVFVGKTNMHELGGGVTTINPFFGTTRNPWDVTRIAGGSSGGAASAVAASLVDAATGSDTGGSVRIPASFCGCVGLKPTFGRISTAGLLGASPTFDHSGIITRTVADAIRVYAVVAGYDPADPSTVRNEGAPGTTQAVRSPVTATFAPRTLRVGVARNFFFDGIDVEVNRSVENAIDTFRRAKADVRDIGFPIDAGTMGRVFDPIVVAEIHQTFALDWQRRPEAFSKSFASFFAAPLPSGLELAGAHRALREYQAAVRHLFESVDIVVTPTVPVTAPLIDGPIDGARILRNTWPLNAARTPAVSLPCGFDSRGLPIGLQLVAAPFAEDTLFAAALTFEGLSGLHPRRPPM